jgi:predicted Zn-dependent peptidase
MKTKIFSILFIFFLSLTSVAQIDRSKQPEPGPTPTINLGKPQTFELKNGLKVLVVENHKLPRVSATLSLENGPIYEGEKAGVSSLTGSLLGSGTTSVSKDKYNEEIDYLGARVFFSSQSANINALSKYFPRVLELMADAAINPVFTQEEFDKQVAQLLDGIKSGENSVTNIANRVQNLLTYGKDHPYGEYASKETVEKVTLGDVHNFYKNYFVPNNAYLVIVGDVDFKSVKKLVKNNFKDWKKGLLPSYSIPEVKNVDATEINFIDMPNAVQSEVAIINTLNLKMSDPDYFAAILANKILGGGGEGRLFLNLREAHGYTYGSYSSIGNNNYTASKFEASASVRNAVTDSSAVEIVNEIKKIRKELVTEDELKNAKAAYVGSFVRNIEKPETVARFALNIKTKKLPENFYETYLQKLNAVTIADIQRAAQKYISEEQTRIIITGKAIDVLPALEKLPYKISYFDKEGNAAERPELTKPIPDNVTVKTVIDKYLNSIGGRDKIDAVKSLVSKAQATMQGMTLDMETKVVSPNKFSMTMSMAGNVMSKQSFNGEAGYALAMGQKKPIEGDDLEKMKKTTFPIAEIGYLETASLEKIEPVDGVDCYVLNVDDNTKVYYEVESGLKNKQVTTQKGPDGNEMTQTVSYSDYQDVEGIKFPFNTKMSFGPQEIEFKTLEIKINQEISEADFQ